MEGWSDFYTLVGSTAATLIGLIFVVISLGADHARDEHAAGWAHARYFASFPLSP